MIMKLKNSMFPADSGVVNKYITEIFEPANERKLFMLEGQVTHDGPLLDDLETELANSYKNLNWGTPADDGITQSSVENITGWELDMKKLTNLKDL